ncbi:MAG: DUF481 domain-containing protein [Bacteroidia bacterium]|nr:DUF481 domain-containing protein [Bacteroidia bacterium]
MIFSLRVWCFGAWLLTYFYTSGQVVNIESQRFVSADTGLIGNINLSLSVAKNQTLIYNATAISHVQYNWKKPTILLVSSYTFIRAIDQNLVNQTFQHLRFTLNTKAKLTPEAFAQWQNNPIQALQSRTLIGAGSRLRILQNDSLRIFYGLNLMWENELLRTEINRENRDFRISTYLSFYWRIKDQYLISNTTYFQPNITILSDYRISSETRLLLKITKHLSYAVTYNIFHDTYPPAGINKTFYTLTNGFSYLF